MSRGFLGLCTAVQSGPALAARAAAGLMATGMADNAEVVVRKTAATVNGTCAVINPTFA